MPFTDPMADGPAIQAGRLARAQRRPDHDQDARAWCATSARATTTTPIVLMGYYNPIYIYGVDALPRRRQGRRRRRADRRRPAAGGGRRALPARRSRPASTSSASRRRPPTTSACRRCSRNTSGFVYYVSITGITGAAAPDAGKVARGGRRASSATPICRSRSASACARREQAAAIAAGADGVVVGSALVSAVADSLDSRSGKATAAHGQGGDRSGGGLELGGVQRGVRTRRSPAAQAGRPP